MRSILTWLTLLLMAIGLTNSLPAMAENWLAPKRVVPHAQARAANFQFDESLDLDPTERSVVSGNGNAEEVLPFGAFAEDENPWSVGYDEPIAGGPNVSPFPYGVDYWFELNGADKGLGYEGMFFTVGGLFPYAHDDMGGMWFLEGRAHLSENGNFFSNFGWGRRQFITPELSAGVSFWYDYDGDKATQFGHEFHQVGVSGDVSGSWWTARINGYIPVNRKGYQTQGFWQNFVLAGNAVDTAMDGIDGEFGFRVPMPGGRRDAMWSVGGYAYSSDLIESFTGYSTRLELPSQTRAATLQLQLNYDERFKTTGFVNLIYHFGAGGAGRIACSDCDDYSAQGAPLQRTQRNAHIVRFHKNPEIAINPATGGTWRAFHVDNTAGPNGNGTYESPFDTLEEGDNAADAEYDIVFVRDGDGTANGYDTNVALLPNQRLLGDGVAHFIDSQNGLLQLGNDTDGVTPIITNSSGTSVSLANGSVASGFQITNATTGVAGDSSITDTATIDRVTITGGTTAIDLQSVPGTVNVTGSSLVNNTGTSLNIDGGAPTVNFNGTISNSLTGSNSVHVANTTGGTVNIAGTITEEQGQGLLFENVAGDVNVTATTNITDGVDRGIYIRNSSGNFFFDDASITTFFDNTVDLENNVGATIAFNNLQVAPDQSTGLRAINSGTVTVQTGLINSLNGPAVDIQDTAIDITMDNIISSNSTSNGLNFDNATGSFTVNNTTDVTGASGTAISATNSGGLAANFGETTISASASGVNLSSNAGGTFAFQNLDVTSTNGTGLLVNDGGTVNFTGNSPTITASGGPAVNITGSTGQTNGTAGWTFGSLSSSNSTTNGVVLTSLNDDFSVTSGTSVSGAAGTSISLNGGTNDFTFGSPVVISSRNDVGININGTGGDVNFGITSVDNANNVGGAGVIVQNTAASGSTTFSQANVTASGNSVRITDNLGLVTLNGGAMSAGQNGVQIDNSDVNLNNVSVNAGNDGVVVNNGATDRTVNIDSLSVNSAGGQGLELNVNGTGTLTSNITNSTISSTGNAFDAATSAAGGDLVLALDNNTLSSSASAAADVNGSLGGTITVTSLADNTVLAGGTGGMLFDTVTFDSDLTTVGNQQVSGGNTTIGASSSRVQGDGVRLIDVSGDLAFNNLDIFNNNGTGLLVDTKTGGTTFNLVTGSGTIDTTNGTAMFLDPLTVNMNLTSVSSTSAGGNGVHFDEVAGTINIGTVNVSESGGNGVLIENSSANIDFNRVNLAGGGTGMTNGIVLTDNTGTFDLSGGASTISTTSGAGVSVTNQATFTIDNTTMTGIGGAGIDITASGTNDVNATITDNTITCTGNALNATVSASGDTMYLDASGNDSSGGTDVFDLTNNGDNGDFDVRQTAIGAGSLSSLNNGVTINTSGNVIDFNVAP